MAMDNPFEGKEIWFGVGSQDLYGEEALRQVAEQSTQIVDALNASGLIPVTLVLKPTLKSSDGVRQFMIDASANERCIGVITWMHTFSPAKMWIRGLELLKKPLLQLNTQHHLEIPWETIDMDFMNLNQAAHGDREYGYIVSRLGIARKIVVGHYTDPQVARKIGVWARACAGWDASTHMKVMRWGDNMRNVAVTEGDKTEAERVFGASINTWSVNELVAAYEAVPETQVDELIADYQAKYDVAPNLLDPSKDYESLRIAAREEAAMVNMMRANGCTAGVDNFEDLGSLPQLPGVGPQRFPSEYGFGFSAEGDWKTAVLVRIGAVMGYGLEGGASLMEDYSYNLTPGNEMIMGAHMLEVSPSLGTIDKPKLEIHPLGIGGKADPVRLVFTVKPKKNAVVVSMADMRERFRLLLNVVDVVEPLGSLEQLPCARALWKPEPSLDVSAECWLMAGGSHHTCMTTSVGREAWEDFARIAGVELAQIDADTTPRAFERELQLQDIVHRLDNRH
ncbi:L-arabinose isomerase [Bifidobacterium gallicum]|nr:L-arabinose isomerase [Bifidobacterium gallicum]KFI59074.1 arabinose isomerase [Bifidobacterium gallicum DSM 20093 = LMG 11596]